MKRVSERQRKLIRDWIWQTALFQVVLTVIFFWLAGDPAWKWGWYLVVLLALFLAAHPLLLIPISPELLAERERGGRAPGTKKWDVWLSSIASLFWLCAWISAALDYRFNWSPEISAAAHWTGFAGTSAGFGLFLWALATNSFFTEGVRIQRERGHTVCTRGPYRLVRHPGYLGNLFSSLGSALLLGSYWALVPAALGAAAFILRTYWEDETLKAELEGYQEYARQTRFRLFPGIW